MFLCKVHEALQDLFTLYIYRIRPWCDGWVGKGACWQDEQPEFDLLVPHGKRKRTNSHNLCSDPCVYACAHTHIQIYTHKRNAINPLEQWQNGQSKFLRVPVGITQAVITFWFGFFEIQSHIDQAKNWPWTLDLTAFTFQVPLSVPPNLVPGVILTYNICVSLKAHKP